MNSSLISQAFKNTKKEKDQLYSPTQLQGTIVKKNH